MNNSLSYIAPAMISFLLTACVSGEDKPAAYDDDVAFLKKYSQVIELTDSAGKSRVAVMPGLQARVMTSTAGSPGSRSYGWINRALFTSGDTSLQMNAFGGEERFWMGPEGGQFSIFFERDSLFRFENWRTPRLIDLDAFDLVSQTPRSATFHKSASLRNFSGTVFHIRITREISVLDPDQIAGVLDVAYPDGVSGVAYRTVNTLENAGPEAWSKKTGLLSIWLLGMFKPAPALTMVLPYEKGAVFQKGPVVIDDYFGKVPPDRLIVGEHAVFFRGDGTYRSKIGLTPARAKDVMGSYDPDSKTLTVVKFSKGSAGDDYVNSKWEIQEEPFKGDVINAYNDGPPSPGEKPMGPFYELESSSHARELKPGESVVHTQTTFHFEGNHASLNQLAVHLLGVTLQDIEAVFR